MSGWALITMEVDGSTDEIEDDAERLAAEQDAYVCRCRNGVVVIGTWGFYETATVKKIGQSLAKDHSVSRSIVVDANDNSDTATAQMYDSEFELTDSYSGDPYRHGEDVAAYFDMNHGLRPQVQM